MELESSEQAVILFPVKEDSEQELQDFDDMSEEQWKTVIGYADVFSVGRCTNS